MNFYDVLVVGGGAAGCIMAARLSEDPKLQVALIEWGPSDQEEPRAHSIRRWAEMLEGEYDLDYRSVEQSRGNSDIRQARLRILGGCATANTMITWRPLAADLADWARQGAKGWGPEQLWPAYDRLQIPIEPVAEFDQNPVVAEVVESAVVALGLPRRSQWNGELDDCAEGAGFFEVGYTPETNVRGSPSIHYIHPLSGNRENLSVVTGRRAERVLLDDTDRATGVRVIANDGTRSEITARLGVVLCCGAIDTPRLLQLSGIGPAAVLESAGIPVRVDLPGVGENLQDHAEGLVVWEVTEPPPLDVCASGWDAGALVVLDDEPGHPDVAMHFPVEAWTVHPEARGVTMPERIMSIAPNVSRPRSRGRIWITSDDPNQPPSIDYGYFTDPEGHDERILLTGIDMARRIGSTQPFASRIVREVFPGDCGPEELSARARDTHQTVYHVSCTARIGAKDDPMSVLDSDLRVRGTQSLWVCDASAFPTVPAVNPVGTVMSVAEHGSEVIRAQLASSTRRVS